MMLLRNWLRWTGNPYTAERFRISLTMNRCNGSVGLAGNSHLGKRFDNLSKLRELKLDRYCSVVYSCGETTISESYCSLGSLW